MTCSYSISFEFDVKPVKTSKGEISATSVATCAARAIKQAIKEQHPKAWRSVAVVLERQNN